jgi:uncharacterized protein (DUF362 family)
MNEMDRRTFLKRAAQVSAGATALGLGAGVWYGGSRTPWDEDAFPPIGSPRVAVLHATSYDGPLEDLVLDGLRSVGADVRGRSVLLKPNLVEYDPGTVVNTDPRLVASAVLALRRLGARSVRVGEGPGHRRDMAFVGESSGLFDVLRRVDAPFVDLNTSPLVPVRLRSSFTHLETLWLPEPVVGADVVVSMPKLKTHHWAGATLSLKNCFGCVPGRVYGWPKNVLHWAGLEAAIVDVAAAVRPEVQIVDGIVGMQGDGPIRGTPIAAGVLVFGTDPVATDVTAARLMGLEPSRIGYLREAGRFLGQADLERIRQVAEDPERSASNFSVIESFDWIRVGSTATPAEGNAPDAGPA